MSDTPNANGTPPSQAVVPHHPPFPVARLFYSVFYGFIAWFVLHIIFVLAAVQFVMHLINGRPNEEVKSFVNTLLQYEWELLAYITFVRDEQPFPLGPFPKHA